MAQEQTKRGGGGGEDDDLTGSTAAGQERREKLTEETDDLLDENAETFTLTATRTAGNSARTNSNCRGQPVSGRGPTTPGASTRPVNPSVH